MDHIPTGRQVAAARALLGLTQAELAARSNISIPTLKRMEASNGTIPGLANNAVAVLSALRSAGIQFLNAGDTADGVGVVLRR